MARRSAELRAFLSVDETRLSQKSVRHEIKLRDDLGRRWISSRASVCSLWALPMTRRFDGKLLSHVGRPRTMWGKCVWSLCGLAGDEIQSGSHYIETLQATLSRKCSLRWGVGRWQLYLSARLMILMPPSRAVPIMDFEARKKDTKRASRSGIDVILACGWKMSHLLRGSWHTKLASGLACSANIWRCTNDKLRVKFLIVETAPCPINCLPHRDIFSINFLFLALSLSRVLRTEENTKRFSATRRKAVAVTLRNECNFNEPASLIRTKTLSAAIVVAVEREIKTEFSSEIYGG